MEYQHEFLVGQGRWSSASRSVAPPVSEDVAGFTRRDALRRAGIIGAAVVAVPVMDSVLSPAFATTSGGGGGTCTSPSDPAAMCGGKDKKGCQRCQFGQACGDNNDCISKKCVEPKGSAGKGVKGTCGPSATGGECYENNDCAKSDRCTNYNSAHIGTCTPKSTGGTSTAGQVCKTNQDCKSDLECKDDKSSSTKQKTCQAKK